MRVLNRDYLLFGTFCFLCGFEGFLIAMALGAAPLPWFETAQKFQWFANVLVAFCAAVLAYFAAMAKETRDQKNIETEQLGVSNSIASQFIVTAYFTYDVKTRVQRNVNALMDNAQLRKRIVNEIRDLVKAGDAAVDYYRDNFRFAAPHTLEDISSKYVTFRALLNDTKMALEFLEDWNPDPDNWKQEMDTIFWTVRIITGKLITLAFKYNDTMWDEWEKEIEAAMDKRDKEAAEFQQYRIDMDAEAAREAAEAQSKGPTHQEPPAGA